MCFSITCRTPLHLTSLSHFSDDIQAMARCWREGQKRPVHIYRLCMTGTLEENQLQRQSEKSALSTAMMVSSDVDAYLPKDFIKTLCCARTTPRRRKPPSSRNSLLKNFAKFSGSIRPPCPAHTMVYAVVVTSSWNRRTRTRKTLKSRVVRKM